MLSLKEFKEQLELMEKQYGAEEELYPYIYMLLREVGMTQKYSVRSVAGAGSRDNEQGKYKNIFMGYASFPDIVILDKEFQKSNQVNKEYYESEITKLYCCVEAKKIKKDLMNLGNEINIMSGTSTVCVEERYKARCRYYQVLNTQFSETFEKEYCGKAYKIEKKGDDYKIFRIKNKNGIEIKENVDLTVNGEVGNGDISFIINHKDNEVLRVNYNGEKVWECVGKIDEQKSVYEILKQEEFYILILKSSALASINKENRELIYSNTKATDEGQLIGELLWYGRVIYTNGKKWKYLEIVDFDKLCKDVNLAKKRNDLREKCVMVNKNEKYKWCEYFNKVSFQVKETPLITINDSTTEIDWEDFKTKLRNISKDWNKICKEKHNE
ncbi:MAG: hypothetical protein UEA60_10355 [Lachnospiraceae bacterium]|nr:hypothetical protein [Lachnospiraceae bacterium]